MPDVLALMLLWAVLMIHSGNIDSSQQEAERWFSFRLHFSG